MIRKIFNTVLLAACLLTVFYAINGTKIFLDTTPTGGDMAGHVWWPAYLRDHLLPSGRVSGWTMDFYGGFPAGQFYFPLPALIIVALNTVLPYGIAFKLGAVLGTALIPVAAMSFAKNMRWREPAPQLAAVGATWFIMFSGETEKLAFNQRISGGTLASMLVGEFSYGWAVMFMLFGLGFLRRSLREGRGGWVAALCFWAVIWCHVIVAIMAAVLAVVIVLIEVARKPKPEVISKGIVIGAAGGLAAGMWFLPFFLRWETWTTAVRYEKIVSHGGANAASPGPADFMFTDWFRFPAIIAVFGLGAWVALAFERAISREGEFDWGILEACGLAAIGALAFWFWPEGVAWNLRYLPFWYLFISIAAAVVIGEGARAIARAIDHWIEGDVPQFKGSAHTAINRAPLAVMTGILAATGLIATSSVWGGSSGILRQWSSGNWNGFEGYPGYSEYRQVIRTMESLPPGWAKWEEATENGSDNLARYGSDFALVLLPFWTDGKISSYESLYFEGSANTPYNFLTTGHVSRNPSNLIRGLPYVSALTDFDEGVNMMRTLGIRYYMAYSPEALAKASASPGLKLIKTVPDYDRVAPLGWSIFEIRNAALVTPLDREPVVTSIRDRDAWMLLSAQWFEDPTLASQPIVQDGPDSWRRVQADSGKEPDPATLNLLDVPEYREKKIAAAKTLNAVRTMAPKELPKVKVTNIRSTQDSLSFDVDRIGVPVRVRVSAFPNWEVSGGNGPYRASPNHMVVIPTSKHVELHFERTGDELLGTGLTVIGFGSMIGLWWWERSRRRPGPTSGTLSGEPPAHPSVEPPADPIRGESLEDGRIVGHFEHLSSESTQHDRQHFQGI